MRNPRHIAFGYSTKCNIRCGHCVAAGEFSNDVKMEHNRAEAVIKEMACYNVKGISFTAGEPILFFKDICKLIQICEKNNIYSRIVTNGYWAKTRETSDQIVLELKQSGLSQLRISSSRWHQENVDKNNFVNAAASCKKYDLDYFISFVTDFSEQDDTLEQFLQDMKLKYFPEPVIYSGRAEGFRRSTILTDFQPNTCTMNPYLSPELDMFACCDAGKRFEKTDFLYLGNLKDYSIGELFKKKEDNILYSHIRNMGITNIASYLGFKASEIVKCRKCELCEKLFNSVDNLSVLKEAADSDLMTWSR